MKQFKLNVKKIKRYKDQGYFHIFIIDIQINIVRKCLLCLLVCN